MSQSLSTAGQTTPQAAAQPAPLSAHPDYALEPGTLQLCPERAVLPSGAGVAHLLVRFQAPQASGRPLPGSTAIVIDASGSMAGLPLTLALQAARDVTRGLGARDQVTVVLFGSRVEVVVPPCPAPQAAQRLAELQPRNLGGTDLYAGWHRAAQLVAEMLPHAGGYGRILLLTDGHANEGLCRPADLTGAFRVMAGHNIQTSCLGLGEGYDQRLLSALAECGDGVLDHASTPAELEAALASQLGDTGALCATDLELSAELPGLGVRRSAGLQAGEGAGPFRLAPLRPGQVREALLALDLPEAGPEGLEVTGRVQLRYREGAETKVITLPITLRRGEPSAEVHPLVEAALAVETFAQQQREAAERAARGDLQGSVELLRHAATTMRATGLPMAQAYADNAEGALHQLSAGLTNPELYSRSLLSYATNAAVGRVAAGAARAGGASGDEVTS